MSTVSNTKTSVYGPKWAISVGDTYGDWTVESYEGRNANRKYWNCRCVCGNLRKVTQDNLRTSRSTKCTECARRNRPYKDLTGLSFGGWTVKERAEKTPSGNQKWLCKCVCGTTRSVGYGGLVSGRSTGCGCSKEYKHSYVVRGYVFLRAPDNHPNAQQNGYIAAHRLAMTEILGRALQPGESVHHINGLKDDNRPENLELWVKGQPTGLRVDDQVAYAVEILRRYRPEILNKRWIK